MGPGGDLATSWAYDVAADTWERLADLPATPRHHPFQFGIDGQAYVFGGHNGPDRFADLHRWEFGPDGAWAGRVVRRASLPAEGRVAGTQLESGGFGYVLSGDGQDHRSMASGEFWRCARRSSREEAPGTPVTNAPLR